MVGDLAAAVALRHLDAARPQPLRARQHVLAAGVAAQGIDVRVLEEQQALRALPALQRGAGRELQLDGPGVGSAAEIVPVEGSAEGAHAAIVDDDRIRWRRPLGEMKPWKRS